MIETSSSHVSTFADKIAKLQWEKVKVYLAKLSLRNVHTLLKLAGVPRPAAHSSQRSGHLHPHPDPWRAGRLRREAEDRRSHPGRERNQSDRGRLPEVQGAGSLIENTDSLKIHC